MSNENENDSSPCAIILGRMEDDSLPPIIRDKFRQHYENLIRLAGDLKNLGMAQQQIDEQIVEIFNEYERELDINIQRIKAAHRNRQ